MDKLLGMILLALVFVYAAWELKTDLAHAKNFNTRQIASLKQQRKSNEIPMWQHPCMYNACTLGASPNYKFKVY